MGNEDGPARNVTVNGETTVDGVSASVKKVTKHCSRAGRKHKVRGTKESAADREM